MNDCTLDTLELAKVLTLIKQAISVKDDHELTDQEVVILSQAYEVAIQGAKLLNSEPCEYVAQQEHERMKRISLTRSRIRNW